VHPGLNTVGAVTGRMSSAGPNFQNFSKRDPRHRGLFVPEPGCVLVAIDFDQVELRVVAALAREDKMIDVILAGAEDPEHPDLYDLHQLTANEITAAGVEIDRDTGKMANFLIVYGGGGRALAEQAGLPEDLAASIVHVHHERFAAITALAKELEGNTDWVRTISYRRVPVPINPKTGQPKTYKNINSAVQSAARELLVDAWLRFALEFGHGGLVWFPVHDELILQVPESRVAAVVADAERCMTFDFLGVPITAEAVVLRDENGASRWMTAKHAAKIAEGASRAAA
jgi:DNA polymerase-1